MMVRMWIFVVIWLTNGCIMSDPNIANIFRWLLSWDTTHNNNSQRTVFICSCLSDNKFKFNLRQNYFVIMLKQWMILSRFFKSISSTDSTNNTDTDDQRPQKSLQPAVQILKILVHNRLLQPYLGYRRFLFLAVFVYQSILKQFWCSPG